MSISLKSNKNSGIKIQIEIRETTSGSIPKYIELFDKGLNLTQSFWIRGNSYSINNLRSGLYLLRVSLSSGIQRDATMKLKASKITEVNFDFRNSTSKNLPEWATLTKGIKTNSYNIKKNDFLEIEGRIWKYENKRWSATVISEMTNYAVTPAGAVFDFGLYPTMNILELSCLGKPSLFVCLPPDNNLKCLIRLSSGEAKGAHPLKVTVSTSNIKVETLLTLLSNGAINKAEKLTKAIEAENLLEEKRQNPSAAAVGGYFLLKIGDLERLHDWANNLANWFEWMPDGAIIHAAQLMAKSNKTREDIAKIRSRLLEAVDRGVPIFSEGLKILHEGLTKLWYYTNQEDIIIRRYLDWVIEIIQTVDWDQETSTYQRNPEWNELPVPLLTNSQPSYRNPRHSIERRNLAKAVNTYSNFQKKKMLNRVK